MGCLGAEGVVLFARALALLMNAVSFPLLLMVRCLMGVRVAGVGLALVLAALPVGGQSLPPGVLKLHSRGTGDKSGEDFGVSVAVSDTWMVVGESSNDDSASDAGAAYVYAATTGRFVRRLTPRPDLPADASFGTSVAISGPLAVVGSVGEDGRRGAAYVFDLRTGRQLARLVAADGIGQDFLGSSVTLAGDLALVGAPAFFTGRSGAAYLFHARTGQQLGKITASNGVANDSFGFSVSLSGSLAVVGASGARGGPGSTVANAGAAYVYDVSGDFVLGGGVSELAILTASDGAGGDFFGGSVSLSGHRALIGAFAKGLGGISRGKAYLFDARATTSTSIGSFQLGAAAAADFDQFGVGVALNGNLAVIGAIGKSTVFLYDTNTGGEIGQLRPPDAAGNDFGLPVAVAGNRVLVGARQDADLGVDAGAAYLFNPVSMSLPLTAVAKVGDFAPGTVETNFSSFPAAYLNNEGEVGLSGMLSNRGRGVWSQYAGPLRSAMRVGEEVDSGIFVSGIGEIIPEHGDGLLIQATLRGQGFNATNNQFWLRHNGGNLFDMLQIGLPYDKEDGSPAVLSLPEVVQRADSGHVLAAYTLARSATTGATAANDSGVTYRTSSGSTDGARDSDTRHREGEAAPTGNAGDRYGQFFGRVGLSPTNVFFTFPAFYLDTSLADPLPDVVRQGVFFDALGSDTTGVVARQGQSTVGLQGVPAPTFRGFLGEAMSDLGFSVFRALVTGTGITAANDEGIFNEQTQRPYLREGQALDLANAPGLVIAGFLGYWPVDADSKIIALVKLRGPGVTGANDCAVVLAGRTNNYLQILLREGDLAGADDASRIATLQRVDADSVNGHYHILASLTGSSGRNQALFQGNVELGDNDDRIGSRLPAMVLRKGQGYQQPGGVTSTIKTMTLPVSTDRTGAGAKGHGQAINSAGEVVITLEFGNRAREVWKGRP